MSANNQTPSLGRPRFKDQFQNIQADLQRQSRSFQNNWAPEAFAPDGKNCSSTQTYDSFDPKQMQPAQDWGQSEQTWQNCNWPNFGQINYTNLMKFMPYYNFYSYIPYFDVSLYSRMGRRERKQWRAQYERIMKQFQSKMGDDFNFGLDSYVSNFDFLVSDENVHVND